MTTPTEHDHRAALAANLRRRKLPTYADAVLRLPVIPTCGEYRWCHPSEVCTHPKAHAEHEIDGCAMPPPSWCPMRGGAR